MIDAIILDTETTGIEDSPEVIQLAWKQPDGPGLVAATFKKMYRPSKPIEWGAIAVHHILPEDLAGCEPSSQAPFDIPPSTFIIGHKVDFDWEVLGRPDSRRICTLALARELWPETDSHGLVAMMYFLRGANPTTRALVKGAHSAADDVAMCELLLQEILVKVGVKSYEALWRLSEEARIPKIMTFGKFKGKPISAVDRGYMNWYRRQEDPDGYVLEAFRRNGM